MVQYAEQSHARDEHTHYRENPAETGEEAPGKDEDFGSCGAKLLLSFDRLQMHHDTCLQTPTDGKDQDGGCI